VTIGSQDGFFFTESKLIDMCLFLTYSCFRPEYAASLLCSHVHSSPLGCGWIRWPPGMDSSFKYVE